MPTLSEAQASATATLTAAFKAQQNREAAKVAALVALYYRQRVNVEDPRSIEDWLDLMIPRLIARSDASAREAAAFYTAVRRLEVPDAAPFTPEAALGYIDEGVRKSLLTVGPYDYVNKATKIRQSDASPAVQKALLNEAKATTTNALAASTMRHAQAGGRQTIFGNAQEDRVALGWVRVTQATPCAFCALLASRGLRYRAYKEGAFDLSNDQFTGSGDAKVHDNCGCSLKPVYVKDDPLVKATDKFADLYQRWGAGGGDAALRFRRGYDHWVDTGEYLSWDQANEGLRAA